MENLSGKTVLLGITGGIAAYKMANVTSALRKTGAEVHCILTQNATQFITPLTFETLSNNRCIVDTFDRNFQYDVAHVSLAKKADVILIAPATANVIAKLAHGLADDMLTTTVLAARCPKLIAPAMNTAMLENPATQENLATLRRYGFTVIEPATGMLACKDVGSGKLPEPEVLCEEIYRVIAREKDLQGLHITVTAGPTQESLDPVRFLTNHSSGKMGYAIAREAMLRGADVTLISGPVALKAPLGVKLVHITTAQEMLERVQAALPQTDVLVMAAAVADYRPAVVADQKMKKGEGDMSIPLERTGDVLGWVAQNRHPGLFVCGFSMETEHMLENSQKKLTKKKLDMIVANNLKTQGAGFGVETNVVTLITQDWVEELPLLGKDEVAGKLLTAIAAQRQTVAAEE
jgi:phosphopantothenoylcysteine decarboxylase/phosphopantothenate--cysteine ligase